MTVPKYGGVTFCLLGAILFPQLAGAFGIYGDNSGIPILDRPIVFVQSSDPLSTDANLYKVQAANVVVFMGTAYLLGLLVKCDNWKVGYTRKILAGVLYLAPFQIGAWWPIEYSTSSLTLTCIVFSACLLTCAKPLRSRVPFLATAFAAIDRPEDRPLTLTWLLSSLFVVWAILMIWAMILPVPVAYVILALFISGVADAVAEPVGVRFGRHRYKTRALWTDKTYTRSLEGSAAFCLTTIVGVFFVSHATNGFGGPGAFYLTLILFPIVATLVEAKSPHTWDQPFLIGSSGLLACVIYLIS